MESNNDSETFRNMYSQYMSTEAHLYKNPAFVSSEILKAVIEEDLSKLKNLVNSGHNLNVSDNFGNGPLHIAIFKENSEMVEYLLTKGTYIHKFINSRNFLGETPLFKAISCRKYDLAEKLIHVGADVNIPNNSQVTALHYAVTVPEVAHLLIKHGADVDARNLINQTPLHLAVERECLESVYMLLYYNADANCRDWKDYTPFMRAIDTKNIEMQEALFEYVDDFNASLEDDWTILGLALAEDSPFVEEIINRGADVNMVNNYENGAFFLSLQYPRLASRKLNPKIFKLVWDNIDYNLSKRRSVFGDLFLVERDYFQDVLDIIIESDKFSRAAESVCYSDDLHMFTYKFAEVKLPLKKITEVFCMLLTYGYTPNSYDMSVIFNHYGHCELFRILLYMDIRIKDDDSWLGIPDKIPTRLMYDVKFELNVLLEDLVYIINEGIYTYDDSIALVIIRLLDYCVYPKLINAYLNLNKTDCVTLKIKALPKVPSLLELARNATRDSIIYSFSVRNSCELYTLIDNLDIPSVYKKILTFETVIYQPTYTVKEFETFLKMLDKCRVIREIIKPLIQSAHINANII